MQVESGFSGMKTPAVAGIRSGYRIAIFTALSDFQDTPWWAIITASPHVGSILICQQRRPGGRQAALRSLRANVRKHGLLFIPYRLWAAVAERSAHLPVSVRYGQANVSVETIVAPSIHAPEVLSAVAAWQPDLGLSIGAPILRETLFSLPKFGTVNVHCGEVPFFRGAPPGYWEIATGATRIGATVHRVDAGLDTGRIIAQATAPLYDVDSAETAAARAYELGERVFEGAFAALCESPSLEGVPQSEGGTTFRSPLVSHRMRLGTRLLGRRLRRSLAPRVLGKRLAAIGILGVVRPVRDAIRTLRGAHPVRVFNFHRVTDLCRDGMTVSPAVFAEQIRYLQRRHSVVSLEEALQAIRERRRLRRPLAVITFDDAYRSVFTHAAPILRDRSAVATCFTSTGLVGTSRRFDHDVDSPVREYLDVMSWEEIEALRSEGWSVGAHTVNHARLSACDPDQLRAELADSKSELARRFALEDVALAYPFGTRADITPAGRALARELGYGSCFGNYGGENATGADPFMLCRIDLGANHDRLMWKLYANGFDLGKVRERFEK